MKIMAYALALGLALGLGGCESIGLSKTFTVSLAPPAMPDLAGGGDRRFSSLSAPMR